MQFILTFSIFCFTTTYGSNTLLKTIGRQYNQMNYLSVKSPISQFDKSSKGRCAAQCARLLSTCNIAVFNSTTSQCVLYRESLNIANLTPSAAVTVVDFGRNNSIAGCLSSGGIIALSSYNLITLGDLGMVSFVQNRTIVCGSFVTSSSTDFSNTINSTTYPPTSYTLEINGNITSGTTIQVLVGSFGVGTSPSHTITMVNNLIYLLDGRAILMQQGNSGAKVNVDANLTAKCTTVTNDIQTLSNELATLANISENNASIPTSVASPLIFYVNEVDINGFAVFYVDGNAALNNPLVQTIQIIIAANITAAVQLVVINVSGTNITFAQGNMGGTWLSTMNTGQSHTIWNFYQATSINIQLNWLGALLAPYASVSSNVNINGTVAVQSLNMVVDVNNPPIAIPSCV